MTLGSDVSRLSTTAAGAAAQGLSIVVPLYNEAAGLAVLHARLVGLARSLKARYGLASEVDTGSRQENASKQKFSPPYCRKNASRRANSGFSRSST